MDIKQLRQDLKLTQVELALKIGVSPQTIRMWEWKVSTPNKKNMIKLKELKK